jgi:hypothetical protein
MVMRAFMLTSAILPSMPESRATPGSKREKRDEVSLLSSIGPRA